MAASISFGSWVRKRRRELGIPQQDLADNIGCSLVTLQKIESGKRRPSRQIALLLAAQLKVPTDEQEAFVTFARTAQESGGEGVAGADEHAPWRAARLRHANLPYLLSPLIGREQEQSELCDLLLEPRARLVTLAGPPGIGKTRLALEVASTVADRFEDGAFLVDLAPVSDPDLVIPAIARALDLREASGQTINFVLNEYIGNKRMLLLLDNFEQVLDAAPAVVALLHASPWLKVLVTSREALHVHGERHFAVPPLELPDPALYKEGARENISQLETRNSQLEALARNPCVQLLVEQAKAINPHFTLTPENAEDIASICIHLDGLPLAIGLAASAVALSPKQARGALSNRLAFLRAGARDLPTRQRTLRRAIEWSYDLLSPQEQVLFRRLGVFVAGFNSSAAQTIASDDGRWTMDASLHRTIVHRPSSIVPMLDGLESLLRKNLLRDEEQPDDEPRFRMLETIREFAAECLAESGEEDAVRRTAADYYLDFVEGSQQELTGPNQVIWLQRIDREHDNLRAVLNWAQETGDVETGLRLSGALWRFWRLRGYLSEGQDWLDEALAGVGKLERSNVRTLIKESESSNLPTFQHSNVPTFQLARARALNGATVLARVQADYVKARSYGIEHLALCRELGDKAETANALNNLGVVTWAQGDYDSARTYHEGSLSLRREIGDKAGAAASLNNLGLLVYVQGDFAAARSYYDESAAIRREIGDKIGLANTLLNLGNVLTIQEDFDLARSLQEEVLSIRREAGDRAGVAGALLNLAHVVMAQEDYAYARSLYEESLSMSREVGDKANVGDALHGLGNQAWFQRDYDRARAFYQESLAMRQQIGEKRGIAASFLNLGHVTQRQGDPEGAELLYTQSLELFNEQGSKYGIMACIAGFGAAAAERGQAERAARLFGATEMVGENMGGGMGVRTDDLEVYEEGVAIARKQLGDPAFDQAWAKGHALTLEEAVSYALDIEVKRGP